MKSKKLIVLGMLCYGTLAFTHVAPKTIPPAPAKVETPKIETANPAVVVPKEEPSTYDPTQFYGVLVNGADGKMLYIDENPLQKHNRQNCAMLRVKNIKKTPAARQKGRIRVAVWDSEATYAKEGIKPFRASSYEAKQVSNDEMLFRICGLEVGKEYSFFAHFDENNVRKVERNWLGIPKNQFIFSNAKTQGAGAGLSREGLFAPKFGSTVVKFMRNGQEILLPF